MAGAVEAKAVFFDRDGVPARDGELLEGSMRDAGAFERERRAEPGETGSEDGDGHAFFGKRAGHGRGDRTEGSRGCKACRGLWTGATMQP
jgi:hypothetical protein